MGVVAEGLRVECRGRGSGNGREGWGGEREQVQTRWMGVCDWVYAHTCRLDICIP